MAGRHCWFSTFILCFVSVTVVMGARIRPGGDPSTDRVIWADPFDNYSQWAWDNRNNVAYEPNGTLWQGGPMPAGSASGIYPYKSDNGTTNPYNGCGVTYQELPVLHGLAREQWVGYNCGNIHTPTGFTATPCTFYAGPDKFKDGSNCTSGGWVETISEFGRVDSVWQHESGYYTSLNIFTHDLRPRIQNWSPLRAWDASYPNAVQGTDEHPLTLVFYLHDSGSAPNPRAFLNNTYVELNLDDEHAPTDYIWRGKRDKNYESGDPECCPQGPYPVICQQVREVNEGNFEQVEDLQYLNDHCPSLVPPFDAQTGTGKTWSSIAFGFLSVACKDPCTCEEQGSGAHIPTMNHPVLFDGNVWRELRSGRGNALTECPPGWGTGAPGYTGPETTMQDSGAGECGNFVLGGGTHVVYLKLTTDKILIWMKSSIGDYCGAFDRVYKGPFNRVAVGVGPGCELQDKATQGDSYTCKVGGTPTQCLTYADSMTDGPNPQYTDGYWRSQVDAMSLLDGALVYNPNSVEWGACCHIDTGICEDDVQPLDCPAPGIWHNAKHCLDILCCVDPFADADADGDVDQADFGIWQTCYSGSGNLYPSGDNYPCRCFNREGGDLDIDDLDFQAFSSCLSGPAVPVNPACDD